MRMPPAHATTAIAVATVGAWLAVAAAGLTERAAIVGGFIPVRFTLGPDIVDAVPAWLTPLSATLVHGGFFHLGVNLLMLVFCGRLVEVAVGRWGVATIYVTGAYAAALGQYLADPGSTTPMIGSSGAASALIGAYAILYGTRTARAIGPVPANVVQVVWLALAWIGVQLLVGFATGGEIAIFAHIGGFFAGLALARPALRWRYRNA
jgi:membrane associated rhomboid family serine protease